MASQSSGLHELYQQAKALAYGIWRKRWYMLVTTWAIAIVGWGVVFNMPYRYTANARILVDANTLLPQLVRTGGVRIDQDKKIELVRKTLLSRPNLEKIVGRSEYLERLAQNSGELNRLVNKMQREIRVVALNQGQYQITYEVDERRLSPRQRAEVARTVVSNLLGLFREGTGKNNTEDLTSASSFLDARLKDLGEQLKAAEAAQAKFKQDNIEYLGNVNFLTRLEKAQADLRETRSQIAQLKQTQRTLENQLKSIPSTIKSAATGGSGGKGRDPLDERIAEQRKKLDQLAALGYKERHPDVVNVTRTLNGILKEKEQQMADLQDELSSSADTGKTSTLTRTQPNRLYEQIMLENIGTLSQISGLEQREIEQEAAVAELIEKSKRVPEIEAEESELKRGYDNLRSQHRKLQKQKSEVDIQERVSESESTVAFRVVEPPVTPQSPSGPPRLLLMIGVLVGALVGGFGIALVLSQLKPVVITVEQLRNHFDLPVLGNVTRALSDVETKQRSMEMLAYMGATVALFLVFAILIGLDIFGAPTVG